MSLTNPNKPVTEARLQEFYHRIKSYLGFTEMPSEDMSEVISPLPSVQPRYHKYSTDEQVVGEWVDGRPIYEKSFQITNAGIVVAQTGTGTSIFDATSLNIANVIEPISGYCDWGNNNFQTLPTSFMTQEQWVVCDLYYNPLTKIISFRGQRKTGSTNVNNIWFTIRYTKTT